MKTSLMVLSAAILMLGFSFASEKTVEASYVNGYYRSNGTYVNPYYRSNNNGLRYDNYSYKPYQPHYNPSVTKYGTYKWTTPSWNTQTDYYYGKSYYDNNQYNY